MQDFWPNGKSHNKLFALNSNPLAEWTINNSDDAAQLLPQLLDRLAELGDMAKQLSHQLGGNGNRPEQARELIEEAVTAIRKGAVGAERRRVGNRYQWFVDFNGLAHYCGSHPAVRRRQRLIKMIKE